MYNLRLVSASTGPFWSGVYGADRSALEMRVTEATTWGRQNDTSQHHVCVVNFTTIITAHTTTTLPHTLPHCNLKSNVIEDVKTLSICVHIILTMM